LNGVCKPLPVVSLPTFPAGFRMANVDDARYYVIGVREGEDHFQSFAIPREQSTFEKVGPLGTHVAFVLLDGERLVIGYGFTGEPTLGSFELSGDAGRPLAQVEEITGVALRKNDAIVTSRSGGLVRRFSTSDGGGFPVASAQASPTDVVASEDASAWLNMPRLAPAAGPAGSLEQVRFPSESRASSAPLPFPSGLSQDDLAYYFYEGDSGEFRRIAKGAVQGEGGTPLARWTKGLLSVSAIVRGDYIYWSFLGDGVLTEVVRVPRCGGSPLRIATPNDKPSLVADREHLYWTIGSTIMKIPL
jgi:hypothetical protein